MKKKIIIVLIALVLIISLSSTFAYLRAEVISENSNRFTLADFKVDLITDINNVTIDKTFPMPDSEGLKNQSIRFQIQNNGNIIAGYKVSLIDKDVISTLKNSDVKYSLKRTVGDNDEEDLGIFTLSEDGLIDEGSIEMTEIITYELVMWVDQNSNSQGTTFNKHVLVDGMQISNLDRSRANFPELLDNMIPVYYDETGGTGGVWKKADSRNIDVNYKWFDYDNFMWANAVTVKENGTKSRDTYLKSEYGTEISMDDILSMWVWIPRYKYVVFNADNGGINEKKINIIFEHGRDKTGTITCTDSITTSGDNTSSQNCTDTVNNGIVNGKSTYNHPAFTVDNKELTGFWISKFEISTDNEDCLSNMNESSCNKQGLNIISKPDQFSLRNINVENIFANVREMEISENVHGFKQNENATLNTNLSGEITNDDNNFDTHMMKNTEWGAVAYLTYSKFGKRENEKFTKLDKEVFINNNIDYKTGYSGASYDSSASNSLTYQYNDVVNGIGASTTGTVYGIYDMSGGADEYVMATSNGFASGWTSATKPLTKYYDNYSSSSASTSYSRGKLGDATKEFIKDTSTFTKWYSDANNFMYGDSNTFICRGGANNNTIEAGILSSNTATGSASSNITSRAVLSIVRPFPWLDN